MGLFFNSSPFDAEVEKVTDEKNVEEDWGLIMNLCDRVQTSPNGAKDCLKSIYKRLNHQDPHVVIQAITLLDACVNNCGKSFMLEVASREFETEYHKLLNKSHVKIIEKLLITLKKWAEGDFKKDSQLSLIPGLYQKLKKEGIDFNIGESAKKIRPINKDPNVVSSQQEEDDIAKAIRLSLQIGKEEPAASVPQSSLYPSACASTSSDTITKDVKKARALYDFEAAEDNELTFKAGEIVVISDDSDANWWKGSNHRGEGLFPANFVDTNLEAEPEQFKEEKKYKSVQFSEEVHTAKIEEPPVIDEEAITDVLRLLHDADPTSPESDPPELASQEQKVNAMAPLIDAELEVVDRRHAELTRLSTELVEAMNMYHQLMRDIPQASSVYMPSAYGANYMYNPHYSNQTVTQMHHMNGQAIAQQAPPPYQGDPSMYPGSAPPSSNEQTPPPSSTAGVNYVTQPPPVAYPTYIQQMTNDANPPSYMSAMAAGPSPQFPSQQMGANPHLHPQHQSQIM